MGGWKISFEKRLNLITVCLANDVDDALFEEGVESEEQEILTAYQHAVKQGDEHHVYSPEALLCEDKIDGTLNICDESREKKDAEIGKWQFVVFYNHVVRHQVE